MQIIHKHQEKKHAFATIRGGKQIDETLRSEEKQLLDQVSFTLSIVYGGEQRRRRPHSA
jgi:hypothetical protein